MRNRFYAAALGAAVLMGACTESTTVEPNFKPAPPSDGGTIPYDGNGFIVGDLGEIVLKDERCGLGANDGGTGVGILPNQPYLLWILTANGATSAVLNGLPGSPLPMTKVGGTYKLVTPYYAPNLLVGIVSATYTGKVNGAIQLTISHGCAPFVGVAAWCSPGFWGNAQPNAFLQTTVDPSAQTFNANVFGFASNATGFAETFGFTVDPSLLTVLTTTGNTYKQNSADYDFPNSLGILVGANAFNGTAGYLTSSIKPNPYTGDVYVFDPAQVGQDHFCPLDNKGNYKITQ